MNGCPAKAVGSIAGDADKALGHDLTPSRGSVRQAEIFGGVGGQHPPTASPLVSCAESPARPS
jgi:hypothetical protein